MGGAPGVVVTRKPTVILVTHDLRRYVLANRIVVITRPAASSRTKLPFERPHHCDDHDAGFVALNQRLVV